MLQEHLQRSRAEINRANAQHSTGPRTDPGKAHSKFNALRHGLTGQVILMPGEDHEVYANFCENLKHDLRPVGAMEEAFAQSLADAQWQLNRARAIENNFFFAGAKLSPEETAAGQDQLKFALSMVDTFKDNAKQFDNISRYAARLHRQVLQLHNQLRGLEQDRQGAREKHHQAILQRRDARAKQPHNQQQNQPPRQASGFVSHSPQTAPSIPAKPATPGVQSNPERIGKTAA
jgi:hypothetical protein